MPIPTEAGHYWFRWGIGEWQCATVLLAYGVPVAWIGHERYDNERAADGIWGPRIPGPARLAALEELAAKEPLGYDALEFVICCYCHAVMPNDQAEASFHKPVCPWQRAQERADDAT